MVSSGLIVGLATGGYPAFSREISQIALVVAMSFSLTEIGFSGISPTSEARGFLLSLGMSYGVLSGLLLAFAILSPDPSVREGWVLMAAVPPAIAVIPVTSLLRGDVRRALISLALLYLLGIALVPGITLAVIGRGVPVDALFLQTLVLIGVPILVSRPLRRWHRTAEIRPDAVGLSFFFLVLAIAGSTRDTLFGAPDLLVSLSAASFLRTFGLGIALYAITRGLGLPRRDQVTAATFSSFKNLGLTVVLAFSFFDKKATLPSIVSLVFEVLWLAALPYLFRARGPRVARWPRVTDPGTQRRG